MLALKALIPQVTALDDLMVQSTLWPFPSNGPQYSLMGYMPYELMITQQFPWFGNPAGGTTGNRGGTNSLPNQSSDAVVFLMLGKIARMGPNRPDATTRLSVGRWDRGHERRTTGGATLRRFGAERSALTSPDERRSSGPSADGSTVNSSAVRGLPIRVILCVGTSSTVDCSATRTPMGC